MVSLEKAHATLLEDRRLQFDLKPFTPPQPPFSLHFSLGGTGEVLAWLVLIALAVAVLFYAGRYAWTHRSVASSTAAAAPVAVPPEIASAMAGLAEADRLAAGGQYLEAAHVLLAGGAAEIGRRYPALVRPASTSRDIAVTPGLPGSIKTSFGRMAAALEPGLFGGRPVGGPRYAEIRQLYVASAIAGDF